MLFYPETLERIAAGGVTVAFRRWRRPSVRAGGTLLTPAGELAIDAVDPIEPSSITEADAVAAGQPSREALFASLAPEGTLYRIAFHVAGPDPRIALREQSSLSPDELSAVFAKLARLDISSTHGAWTRATLEAIRDHPAAPAATLAASLGRERLAFKTDVRKLKALGLSESLAIGYRLSPRGAAVLASITENEAERGFA